MDRDSRVVLVTGVSRGLGAAIARGLLDLGYVVVGVARTLSDRVEALLAEQPDRFHFESFDLGAPDSIHAFVTGLVKRHGRFYGLVNNAGVGLDGVLATMHEKDIHAVINLNLVTPILLCKYLSRGMLANGRGRIVNISSIIGRTGFSGLSVYGATKAGIHGLTQSLSRELGKAGITVNTVSPGYLETRMSGTLEGDRLDSIRRRSPFARFPSVEEVANVVCFLMSDQGSGVHGANVVVDLGSTA
jgi:3-oxoacyl-[acyl-carrier protein] reductase